MIHVIARYATGARVAEMRLVLVACLLATGCGALTPDARSCSQRARETEPRCAGVTDESVARILAPASIDAVEPAYSYALGGPNGRQARLSGAKIHLAANTGATKEALTRTLRCHEARVLLGKAESRANDPYTLSEQWLDIDVDSTDDGWVVQVATDQTDDAQTVLDRARLYSHP